MKMKNDLGIYSLGFEKPSPIQQRGIVASIQGRDVICQSQSGTGKTATFSTAILQRINENERGIQALVLSPTRELAQQTFDVIKGLSGYFNGLEIELCVGGTNVAMNAQNLRKKPQIVIGTPGRCLDFISRGSLCCDEIKMLVLDEMDVLLSSGFKDTIYDIFSQLPTSVQVILVSATMPPDALSISNKFMRDPIQILVKRESIALSGIRQFYVDVQLEEFKFETLCDLYGWFLTSLHSSLLFFHFDLKHLQYLILKNIFGIFFRFNFGESKCGLCEHCEKSTMVSQFFPFLFTSSLLLLLLPKSSSSLALGSHSLCSNTGFHRNWKERISQLE